MEQVYIQNCGTYYNIIIYKDNAGIYVSYFTKNDLRDLGPRCLKTRLKLDLKGTGFEHLLDSIWDEVVSVYEYISNVNSLNRFTV